jgi:indolepyruvate ferredoxin oxidoreductase beta subunit
MRCDIVLAGVGGQGVLSLSAMIAAGALRDGLYVKQAEVHGMSQRGGAVIADLRLSDEPIWSDIVPRGAASLLLAMEPLEALRYLGSLRPDGVLISSTSPVGNIPDYPDLDGLLTEIRSRPRARLRDAEALAAEAGSKRATNMVIVGAAADLLPVRVETLEAYIRETFARKGEKVVEANLRAFQAGRERAVGGVG